MSQPEKTPTAMPLTLMQPGVRARVRAVNGGYGFVQRLAAMGVLPGAELLLVGGALGGPTIVQVGESRYVIGRGMGHRIMVEPLLPSSPRSQGAAGGA